MANLIQSVEFFVVGGPVQASRSCYVERRADRELLDAIVGQRFAYVFAPRGAGKTSLMMRTSRELRAAEQLTAVIDLGQADAHGEGSDASRWFYGIAHRICREIRLKFDLQAWWQERSALAADLRFAEFLGEVLLENTEAPVSIFFDEVEVVSGLAFATDFFALLRNCYALRVSEPHYARLNFVLFGTASAQELCPDPNFSPFPLGEAIRLPDFTLDECYRLEPGFELDSHAAFGLIDRIYSWTSGQPYLTQKLARAVVRRGARLEDVERSVQELFISSSAINGEPQLTHMRSLLSRRTRSTRATLSLLARIARGASVPRDWSHSAQRQLRMSGVVRDASDGNLRIRNRIYERVFTDKWARSAMPVNFRALTSAAAVILVAIALPYWYFTRLPLPYLDVLAAPQSTYEQARDAYEQLRRLPGFDAEAGEQYAQVLARRSREAMTLAEALQVDEELLALPNTADMAAALLGEFWLRRSAAASQAEDRDAALIYASAAVAGLPEQAQPRLRQLVGNDYSRLEQVIRLDGGAREWVADWGRAEIALLDEQHVARTLPWRSDSSPVGMQVTALRTEPLVRELSVDSEGSAGAFDLRITADHGRAGDLAITLTAPSGQAVTRQLTEDLRIDDGFLLDSGMLDGLADERRQGVWRFAIVDGVAGQPGSLHRWALEFQDATETWLGAPVSGIGIPEPRRTNEVVTQLSADGSVAIAWPAAASGSGSVAVWDLPGQQLLRDLRFEEPPGLLRIGPAGTNLLVQSGQVTELIDIASGEVTARIATQTEFVRPPAVSPEGSYLVIAERVEGTVPLFSLIRTADGALVASIEGADSVTHWELGPEARYLAMQFEGRVIRLIDPRRGDLLAELNPDVPARRLLPLTGADTLVTVGDTGAIHAWQLGPGADGLVLSDDWEVGMTTDAGSVSASRAAATVAFAAGSGNVLVHDLSRQRSPAIIRAGRGADTITLQLADDGTQLMTSDGQELRLWRIGEPPLGSGDLVAVTALALGTEGRLTALGHRDGFIRVQSLAGGSSSAAADGVDYLGHRGPITAIALNTAQNLIATGGRDGMARIWNLATLSPADGVMRHPEAPVSGLALSMDAQWLLTAAPGAARLWRLRDQAAVREFPVNGLATAVQFDSRSDLFAVGDSSGNVFAAAPDEAALRLSGRADGSISALAFAAAGNYVASADVLGNIRFWPLGANAEVPQNFSFTQPVRWLEISESGTRMQVQTEQWLHQLVLTDSVWRVVQSRVLPVGLQPGAARLDPADKSWRLLGGLTVGQLLVADVSFESADSPAVGGLRPTPAESDDPASLQRDWQSVLDLSLEADGRVVPRRR